MHNTLNITNGDCAVKLMQQAQIPGDFLPWRDVLHEGPVPENLSLENLSAKRAEYLASLNWGKFNELHNNFIERDNTLTSFENYSKIILWFEHDLYDQLQLLQILDWFADQQTSNTPLYLICTEQYLGRATPDQIVGLQRFIKPVTAKQLELARTAWKAFRESTPEHWFKLLSNDTSALEFLEAAILRMLQEYPSTTNGLSRTANTALQIISRGEIKPAKLFSEYIKTEARVFLGDASFWLILNQLLTATPALITLNSETDTSILPPFEASQKISITATGIAVLNGTTNYSQVAEINRWIGGVKLTNKNHWLWNADKKTILPGLNNST